MKFTPEQKIHYTLRIASGMCFIGHGSFGIITKEIWTNYFGVFGISHDMSYQLMPYVGAIDILFGLIILFYPVRAVLVWLVVWGALTALLRPLSGEPFAEFIERAGNFGAPLGLLLFSGPINIKTLFKPVTANVQLNADTLYKVISCLRIVVFFLLIGHGGLNLMEKKSLVNQYTSLGFSNGATTAQLVGLFEIIGAFAILIRSIRSMVLIFFIWKAGSELFYPHYEMFEWIERGGSYGALLALWFSLDLLPVFKVKVTPSLRNMFLLNGRLTNSARSFSNYDDYTKMKKFLIFFMILSSCHNKDTTSIDNSHVESLAKDFMRTTVIPKMQDPKPYEVDSAKVVIKTVADQIDDYRFVYDRLSNNYFDSIQNKRRLDSMIDVSKHPDSILNITVNVSYKIRYKRGDVVVDSIKLGYDPAKDKISFWPF